MSSIFQQKYSALLHQKALLIKGNCRDPWEYEMCLQQSYITNSWWYICFILFNKAFYRFWFSPFLQQTNTLCCRLWMCTLLFPCPSMCHCCPGAFHPELSPVLCRFSEDQTCGGSSYLCPWIGLCCYKCLQHFTSYNTFVKPVKTSGVFSSQTSHLRHVSDGLPSSL